MTMYRTPWWSRARSGARMPRSEDTRHARSAPNRLIVALARLRILEPLYRFDVERLQDPLVVRVVVVGEPDRQLETAGADQFAKPLEARNDLATLPAGDGRLRGLGPPGKLPLRQPGAQARLAEEVTTDHISSIREISDMTFERVLVVGAGQMGGGIAQVVAASGRSVALHDALPGAGERALEAMRRSLGKLAEKGGADPDEVLGRVELVDDLAPADLLIEAVVE